MSLQQLISSETALLKELADYTVVSDSWEMARIAWNQDVVLASSIGFLVVLFINTEPMEMWAGNGYPSAQSPLELVHRSREY